MTVEQIRAIRAAQAELQLFDKKQEEKSRAFRDNHWKTRLKPLMKLCDHIYPWGESAAVRDWGTSSMDKKCSICNGHIRE